MQRRGLVLQVLASLFCFFIISNRIKLKEWTIGNKNLILLFPLFFLIINQILCPITTNGKKFVNFWKSWILNLFCIIFVWSLIFLKIIMIFNNFEYNFKKKFLNVKKVILLKIKKETVLRSSIFLDFLKWIN